MSNETPTETGERANQAPNVNNEVRSLPSSPEPELHANRGGRSELVDVLAAEQSVIFVDHLGHRYVWPFERCRSFEMIKPLILEVYILLKDESHMEQVRLGKYQIIYENDGTILPSLWESYVKPSTTISIRFLPDASLYYGGPWPPPERFERPRARTSSPSPERELWRRESAPVEYEGEPIRQRSQGFESPRSSSSESEADDVDDDDEDDVSDVETGSDTENSEHTTLVDQQRSVVDPKDDDGNQLTFKVDTSSLSTDSKKELGVTSASREPPSESPTVNTETLRITKARCIGRHGHNIVELDILPGPENVFLQKSVAMTWYHAPATLVDFTRFRTVCTTIPNLSDRLQSLVREMLARIEKEKVKAFLDGLFIEPGTVLRVDEQNQSDPQSVTFSCVPYLNIQPLAKKLPQGLADHLFPVRTLMQTYYPYEPVRERDAQQALKRFSSDRASDLVHVPVMWIMNIGSRIIVTAGHTPLAEQLVRSITVTPLNLDQLRSRDLTAPVITNVRFTDWLDRVLLFPLNTCRTFFQLQQKITETVFPEDALPTESAPLIWTSPKNEKMKVSSSNWRSMTQRTDLLFIDIAAAGQQETTDADISSKSANVFETISLGSLELVPPFFHWSYKNKSDVVESRKDTDQDLPNVLPADVQRAIRCLDYVEKIMTTETLDKYDTVNAVDQAFTSSAYYHSLPESSPDHVRENLDKLKTEAASKEVVFVNQHTFVIQKQYSGLLDNFAVFFEIVDATFRLFVQDSDKTTMLRKVWGAMENIQAVLEKMHKRGAIPGGATDGPPTFSNTRSRRSRVGEAGWYIRNPEKEEFIPVPQAEAKFKMMIIKCDRCMSMEPFDSAEEALAHLQRHYKRSCRRPKKDNVLQGPEKLPLVEANVPDLNDWIVTLQQSRCEQAGGGSLVILKQSCILALELFEKTKELAEGVMNEDGKMSDLYSFPGSLVGAFRELIVFFLATERALHFTEKAYDEGQGLAPESENHNLPYAKRGLEVLKRFGEGTKSSLALARNELCAMVRTEPQVDIQQQLSLSPEYVCSWLMRRLVVKQLQSRLTIGDMYREYLSTIQFQVNHRPSKRLLKSINLLHEELQVLMQVNGWQLKLVQNYMRVCDDMTFEKDIPSRRANFPYERSLLRSALENLTLSREDFVELIRRCGPLAESTKQSLEINEEDHGKAIMVFTIVTIIFLPLSFLTSYLGMNTVDIRDMESTQAIFWEIAVPLTVFVIASIMYVGYNGDKLRDWTSSIYRRIAGKEDRSTSARGISVAQRKRVRVELESSASLALINDLDEPEFASPQPDFFPDELPRKALIEPRFMESTFETPAATYSGPLVSATAAAAEPTTTTSANVPHMRTRTHTTTYAEPISARMASSAAMPTTTLVPRHDIRTESLDELGYTWHFGRRDPSVYVVDGTVGPREIAELEAHSRALDAQSQVRHVSRPSFAMPTNRIEYVRLPPRPHVRIDRMHTRDEWNEDGESPVQEYTWYKKSRRHGPMGTTSVRREPVSRMAYASRRPMRSGPVRSGVVRADE